MPRYRIGTRASGKNLLDKTMTVVNTFRFLSVLFVAVSMGAGFAHLLKLANKINLSREDYLTVQQIYRGWALLGIAVVGALVSTLVLTVLARQNHSEFYITLFATICFVLSLVEHTSSGSALALYLVALGVGPGRPLNSASGGSCLSVLIGMTYSNTSNEDRENCSQSGQEDRSRG